MKKYEKYIEGRSIIPEGLEPLRFYSEGILRNACKIAELEGELGAMVKEIISVQYGSESYRMLRTDIKSKGAEISKLMKK